jgi:hypothetical protein
MNQIMKHSFEAVSVLTTDNGMIEVTIIPASNQPDWVIPSSLILSVDDYDERIWTYLWQQQEVAVFHLLPRDQAPDKLVVLEGNTPVHRLALQTKGTLRQAKVRISDVKDAELPEHYVNVAFCNIDENKATNNKFEKDRPSIYQTSLKVTYGDESNMVAQVFRENVVLSYIFQTVVIEDVFYLVPDLDKIAHQLVDLDS